MIEYIFLVIFFSIAIIEVFGEFKENNKIIFSTKPILMPLLILFYIFGVIEASSIIRVDWLIVVALISGMGGDIFLMLKDEDNWFLPGMGSFLISQIFYTISFFLSITDYTAFNLWGLFLIIPALLILVFTVPRFINKTENMKIPVLVYMTAIFLMHVSALLRVADLRLLGLPFVFIYTGSLSFILSDATLAVDKWVGEFKNSRLIIISTYILAQFFIVLGALLTANL